MCFVSATRRGVSPRRASRPRAHDRRGWPCNRTRAPSRARRARPGAARCWRSCRRGRRACNHSRRRSGSTNRSRGCLPNGDRRGVGNRFRCGRCDRARIGTRAGRKFFRTPPLLNIILSAARATTRAAFRELASGRTRPAGRQLGSGLGRRRNRPRFQPSPCRSGTAVQSRRRRRSGSARR